MIKVIPIFLMLFSSSLYGQELPIIKSNITEESSVKRKFSTVYSQILSYTRSSYWSSEQTFVIYGFDGQTWERVKWTLKLDDNKQIIKEKVKKMSFSNKDFNELLNFFRSNEFWTFEQDSLNLQEQVKPDGGSTLLTKTDGTNDSFEVISNGNHRIISSYEAEYFQELIPVEQRRKFIECRNKFWNLNKLKRG